jgi:hypothetical protein
MEAGHITPPRGAVRSSCCHPRPIRYSNIVVNLWKVLFGRLDRARRHGNIATMAATYACKSIDQRAAPDEAERDDTHPDGGLPIDAQLEEDEFHMLWLNEPNRKERRMGRYLLSAVLKIGVHRARVTRGAGAAGYARFGSGRVQ